MPDWVTVLTTPPAARPYWAGVIRHVDLELADRGLAGRVGDQGSAPLFREEGLVIVRSIDCVVVEQRADAAEAEQAVGVRIRGDARGKQGEVGPAATVGGEIIYGWRIDGSRKGGV